MLALLAATIEQVQDALFGITLVFIRVGATVALMPGLGEHFIPARIKLLASLCYAMILFPILRDSLPAIASGVGNALLFLGTETIAGLLLGLALRLLLLATQLAGTLIAQTTSLSQMFGQNAAPEPTPAFGSFLVLGATTLAVANGLHVKAALMLLNSYRIMPAGRFPTAASVATWGTNQITYTFSLAVSLSAAVLMFYFLLNIATGAINRAMPAMMVTFVAAPVLSGAGIVLLFILSPALLSVWAEALEHVLADPLGLRR